MTPECNEGCHAERSEVGTRGEAPVVSTSSNLKLIGI